MSLDDPIYVVAGDRAVMSYPSPLRALVAIGCLYELAALPDRSPLPTISDVLQRASRSRRLRVGVWLWCGYVAAHFMGVDR